MPILSLYLSIYLENNSWRREFAARRKLHLKNTTARRSIRNAEQFLWANLDGELKLAEIKPHEEELERRGKKTSK